MRKLLSLLFLLVGFVGCAMIKPSTRFKAVGVEFDPQQCPKSAETGRLDPDIKVFLRVIVHAAPEQARADLQKLVQTLGCYYRYNMTDYRSPQYALVIEAENYDTSPMSCPLIHVRYVIRAGYSGHGTFIDSPTIMTAVYGILDIRQQCEVYLREAAGVMNMIAKGKLPVVTVPNSASNPATSF